MAASTRNLGALPNIESLRRQMQTLALLDAILEREWEYRYFSFNCRWSNTEQMGSMRNGSGDDLLPSSMARAVSCAVLIMSR